RRVEEPEEPGIGGGSRYGLAGAGRAVRIPGDLHPEPALVEAEGRRSRRAAARRRDGRTRVIHEELEAGRHRADRPGVVAEALLNVLVPGDAEDVPLRLQLGPGGGVVGIGG